MSEMGAWVVDPVTQEEILVPPSRTADEAITRAAKLRDGELTVVRILPEHTVRWPLWIAEEGPVEPGTLGVSAGLAERLAEWSARWECRAMSGWLSADEAAGWFADGQMLADLLQDELWEFAEVRREFWGE
ncbi:hypothetical protein [Leifsonia sp. NCR5]|uniref:hypothetical protein n=1 Tax=Leifsonia sp. NCR5 TaxID=1978342 RepID=UPI000A196CEC|nr:hypothetical protein [Leifsonia sp. NCR5]